MDAYRYLQSVSMSCLLLKWKIFFYFLPFASSIIYTPTLYRILNSIPILIPIPIPIPILTPIPILIPILIPIPIPIPILTPIPSSLL